MIEAFGHNRTRGELRSAIYILYKAGYVVQQPQKQNDEYIFIVNLPESEHVISQKMDEVLIDRLVRLCKLHNTAFIPKLVNQLLVNPYPKDRLKALIDNTQIP